MVIFVFRNNRRVLLVLLLFNMILLYLFIYLFVFCFFFTLFGICSWKPVISRDGDKEDLSEKINFSPFSTTFYFLICFLQCHGTLLLSW